MKKNLEKQMMASGFVPNMATGAVLLPYIFCFAGVPVAQIPWALLIGVLFIGSLQFFLAPVTNAAITRSVTKRIEIAQADCLDIHQRTVLVEDIMSLPKPVALQVLYIFVGGCIVWIAACKIIVGFSGGVVFFALCASVYGAVISALFSLNMAEKVCSSFALPIVSQGIDTSYIHKKQFFGISIKKQFIMFVVVPLVLSSFFLLVLILKGYLSHNTWIDVTAIKINIRIPIVLTINVVLSVILCSLFFKSIFSNIGKMRNALLVISEKSDDDNVLIPVDFSNEISYSSFLVNNTLVSFRENFQQLNEIAQSVTEAAGALVKTARQAETISLSQSASVKEIVTTMEDSDKFSRNIASRIAEVALVANKTSEDVCEGVQTIEVNLNKMHEITDANIETINGIKKLSEKIESIWDILTIINNIADQTKIIAFNAELEAASAGEAGRNFHIVANEIRRLASGTMDSTREIKKRITEIQHSSDNLIITSEGGTEKINEGCALSARLEQNFKNISNSAAVTADSSYDIKLIIDQQTAAFEQILITLKQISTNIEQTSSSTKTVTTASEQLLLLADTLTENHNIQKKYYVY